MADQLEDIPTKTRAEQRAVNILKSITKELDDSGWYSDQWLQSVFNQLHKRFDLACDRWRTLYRAAASQRDLQHKLIGDHTKTKEDQDRAKRLRAEAEAQITLLTGEKKFESDFYIYRYFASEGFLPGYSFPRLPLSAYIPGQKSAKGNNNYLSRPRFLAISEYGPRAIVYHEGSRFTINRVIMPVEEGTDKRGITQTSIKQCAKCGYIHPVDGSSQYDLCEQCGHELPAPKSDLFRLQNVVAKRAERISSDEEERQRYGYDIRTGFRFADAGKKGQVVLNAKVVGTDGEIAKLTYGRAATITRINFGWARRKENTHEGFLLDTERGYWATNKNDTNDESDPMSQTTRYVIPFVEDRKNCLIFRPSVQLEPNVMASLQAALKNAIQIEYQLEDSELAAEPLPSPKERNFILFYEAAEGGAGVLRHLLDGGLDMDMRTVARRALEICHYDPDTGEDRKRAPHAREECTAACYDCLRSYSNQNDHQILDRSLVRDFLMNLAGAKVEFSPVSAPRSDHLAQLLSRSDSELEKNWLRFLDENDLNLPSRSQVYFEDCKTRPDFVYDDAQMVVYVDGPHHDYPERKDRDLKQAATMLDYGYTVVRFGHKDDWKKVVAEYPTIFGVSA